MAAKSEGLSAEERQAVKDRAKELRAQEKAGRNRAAGTEAVLTAIAALDDSDRVLAEGLHAVVTEVAPQLIPKTFYGMPGYADAHGKVLVFIQAAGKFGTRYSTITFQDNSVLDDGVIWPVSWAVTEWTPEVAELVSDAVRRGTTPPA